MSGELVTRNPAQDLVLQLRSDQFREQVALALPENVTPERFIRGAVTALLAKPDLADLEINSVFRVLIQCAHDGLLPDGQEAAIVPRKGVATYVPMVGGFRKIAADYGWTLRAQVVYALDEFEYTEEPPTLFHRPVRPGQERGDLIAAYAVANHKDGRRMQCVLHPDEIKKRRAIAQTDAVWKAWTPQMWAKSAARDLFADMPLGEFDERVLRVLEASRMEPVEAAVSMYGPQARESFPTSQETAADAGAQDVGALTSGGQQAEAATPAASAPDLSDEPGLPDETAQTEVPLEVEIPPEVQQAADEAALFVIDAGRFLGSTIGERAAMPEPESWFQYVLARPDLNLYQPVLAFSRVFYPELYAKAAAKGRA